MVPLTRVPFGVPIFDPQPNPSWKVGRKMCKKQRQVLTCQEAASACHPQVYAVGKGPKRASPKPDSQPPKQYMCNVPLGFLWAPSPRRRFCGRPGTPGVNARLLVSLPPERRANAEQLISMLGTKASHTLSGDLWCISGSMVHWGGTWTH